MIDDKISKTIERALLEIKKEHKLEDLEIKKLATLISAVVQSDAYIRLMFYDGVTDVARKIYETLSQERKELEKSIKSNNDDDNNGNILN